MKTMAWIGLGAAIGANLRYAVIMLANKWWGSAFPFGTLIINVSGSFVLGLLYTVLATRSSPLEHNLRLLLGVGLLGGYTTFSTFSLETSQLFMRGELLAGIINMTASAIGSVAGCVLGIMLGNILIGD